MQPEDSKKLSICITARHFECPTRSYAISNVDPGSHSDGRLAQRRRSKTGARMANAYIMESLKRFRVISEIASEVPHSTMSTFTAAHRSYVMSLYKRTLKNSLDWTVRRDLWRAEAMMIRAEFERNR